MMIMMNTPFTFLQVLDVIREKIAKIRNIFSQLQIDEVINDPSELSIEIPGWVLTVNDKELKSEKIDTSPSSSAVTSATAGAGAGGHDHNDDNVMSKALMQMMGGSIKTKKDLNPLEVKLEKEDWMDLVPVEEMTVTQKTAFDEFELKQAALIEEQAKYRRLLESDVRKLKTEIKEAIDNWDKQKLM
jgi:hypothetical protein